LPCHFERTETAAGGLSKEAQDARDRLQKRRLDLGLRQRDVADLLGVHETTVYNWERNRTVPD
jgi:DNA-binding XRE family transcriptional regulator